MILGAFCKPSNMFQSSLLPEFSNLQCQGGGPTQARSKGKEDVNLLWSPILVVRTLMGRLDLGLEELHSLQTIAGRVKGHCLFVSNTTCEDDEECER